LENEIAALLLLDQKINQLQKRQKFSIAKEKENLLLANINERNTILIRLEEKLFIAKLKQTTAQDLEVLSLKLKQKEKLLVDGLDTLTIDENEKPEKVVDEKVKEEVTNQL